MARRTTGSMLPALLLLAGCGRLAPASERPSPPESPAEWIAAADRAEAQGRHGWSAGALERAIEARGPDHDRVLQVVERWLAAGEPARALGAAERYGRHVVPSAALLAAWARSLEAVGRARDAAARWREVAALHPADPGPWMAIGRLYERRLFRKDAIVAYREAVARDPDHPGAALSLGNLLVRGQALTEGIEWIERAVRLAPDTPEPRVLLGHAYRAQHQVARAVAAWESALERGAPPRIHSLAGDLYYRSGELVAAEHHLRQAVAALGDRADQDLLRVVILGREAELASCGVATAPSIEHFQDRVTTRFVAEGWTAAEAVATLRAVLADPPTRRILEQVVSRCTRTGRFIRH